MLRLAFSEMPRAEDLVGLSRASEPRSLAVPDCPMTMDAWHTTIQRILRALAAAPSDGLPRAMSTCARAHGRAHEIVDERGVTMLAVGLQDAQAARLDGDRLFEHLGREQLA